MTERWRRLALYLLLFGTLGRGVELVLLEHYEDPWQWAPLSLLALGFLLAALVRFRPSKKTVSGLRGVMATYLIASAVGLYLHVKSNVEFELEFRPTMAGTELIVETLKGAIPALAPGAMAQLGLLGLLVCFRHPALGSTGTDAHREQESEK